MEINQFVAVTNNPEFFLGTTLLYIDTHNTNNQFLQTVSNFFSIRKVIRGEKKTIRRGLSLIEDLI